MRHERSAAAPCGALALTGGGAVRKGNVAAFPARDVPQVEIVDSLEAMRALGAEWRRLEDEAAAPHNFFQCFDWNMRWSELFLAAADAPRLAIVTGRERGRLVMLWPLMVVRHGPLRVVKWLSDPFLQYGDILLAPGIDRTAWLETGWRAVVSINGAHATQLRKVRADAAVAALLAERCTRTTEKRVSCFIELGGFTDHDALMTALPSRRRQLRRKLRNRLEQEGPLAFCTVHDGDTFHRTIAETLSLKRRWLRDTGLPSKVISDPRLDKLLLSFAGRNEDEPRVAASMLSCAERPVAYEIAFQYRRHHYLYVITQDPVFTALSPSKVQIDLAQGWCIDHGFEVFDLLPPSDRYKRDLSDQTVRIDDFLGAHSAAGALFVAYHARLRPRLKQVYVDRIMPLMARLRRSG